MKATAKDTQPEKLDLGWWHELTGKEQVAYLKKHPGSHYQKHFHMGDGNPPPFDASKFPFKLKDMRMSKIPLSMHAGKNLPEDRWEWHRKRGDKPKEVMIPPEKLRATQAIVDNRWTPKRVSKYHAPIRGLMNKNGFVHILDGHHRADYNYGRGKPTKVLVHPHSTEDEAAFLREYGDEPVTYENMAQPGTKI